MLRIQVILTADETRVLYELAERQRREPRAQAALLLSEALKRRAAQYQRVSAQLNHTPVESETARAS